MNIYVIWMIKINYLNYFIIWTFKLYKQICIEKFMIFKEKTKTKNNKKRKSRRSETEKNATTLLGRPNMIEGVHGRS